MAAETQKLKVFISWAEERARIIAAGFHKHLPEIVNAITPFMSGKDIDKGTQWSAVLNSSLQDSTCAIVCLTRESLQSAWVAFETGAISKAAGNVEGARARIWTYLIGVNSGDVQLLPFGQYQATRATQSETFSLIESVNKLSPDPVGLETLKKRFDALFWPDFSKVLENAQQVAPGKSDAAEETTASGNEVVSEILRTVRSLQREVRTLNGRRREGTSVSHIRMAIDTLMNRLASLGLSGILGAEPIDPNLDHVTLIVDGKRTEIDNELLPEILAFDDEQFRIFAIGLVPDDFPKDKLSNLELAAKIRG